MELRHLRYFIAVAEELHFGRAAKRLHMAQPPLSQQIRSLEEELGVQLFHRTKRPVQLTLSGQAFLHEARRSLAQIEQTVLAAQRAARGEIGRLSIGFVSAAAYSLLPELLQAFRMRFPDVELTLHELPPDQQIQALHEGCIDIGFLTSFLHLPFKDDALSVISVVQEPLMVALPENHPLTRGLQISPRSLAGEPFILFPRHVAADFYDQIVSVCQQTGFSPKVVQEANSFQTIISLVAGGLGISLVPASFQNLHRSGVVYKALQEPTPKIEIIVTYRRDDSSPVLQAFLKVVEERVLHNRKMKAVKERGLPNKKMKCPECESTQFSKNGHRRGKQNYICRKCDRQFVESYSPNGYSDAVKQQCLEMYRNGTGFRAIERLTGVNHNTVINWVKQCL